MNDTFSKLQTCNNLPFDRVLSMHASELAVQTISIMRRRLVVKILFLHGWNSIPGGIKPTYLKDHGHDVINPILHNDDFAEAVSTAQADFDAMSINSGDRMLVLLCPAWRKYGTASTVKTGTVILHSRADDVVPIADSEELIRASELPASALIEIGSDHRLADVESLEVMLRECERAGQGDGLEWYKHHERVEYAVVRVSQLLTQDRNFQGMAAVRRAPRIGDIGTIVFAYDITYFAVECVDKAGMTVWLVDFFAEELEATQDSKADK